MTVVLENYSFNKQIITKINSQLQCTNCFWVNCTKRSVEKFQAWTRVTPVPLRYRLGRTLEYLLVPVKRRCHSPGAKKGFVKGEVLRLLSINSSRSTFNKNMHFFKILLNYKKKKLLEGNFEEKCLRIWSNREKSHSKTSMELDLRSIVNVSLSDGQSSAERSLLLDFPPKCCAARPRRTRCLFPLRKLILLIITLI